MPVLRLDAYLLSFRHQAVQKLKYAELRVHVPPNTTVLWPKRGRFLGTKGVAAYGYRDRFRSISLPCGETDPPAGSKTGDNAFMADWPEKTA